MSEKTPRLKISYEDGSELLSDHTNTTLYTFLGQTAVGDSTFENPSANHVFVRTGFNKDNQPSGIYFFERFHSVYKDIAEFAIKHSFPAILNQPRVPECDLACYMKHVEAEQSAFREKLEGVMPEDFDR